MIPITVTHVLREGKLINNGLIDKVKLDTFLEGLEEGDLVECTYEIKSTSGSYSQLSKLHASIRAIAAETGSSFEEMKLVVKQKAGFVQGSHIKSFGDATKEELSEAIRVTLEIGDLVNVNLR